MNSLDREKEAVVGAWKSRFEWQNTIQVADVHKHIICSPGLCGQFALDTLSNTYINDVVLRYMFLAKPKNVSNQQVYHDHMLFCIK